MWKSIHSQRDDVIYITSNNISINAYPGTKSRNDFIIKYIEPGKRERTPKHIHIIVEMYVKYAYDPRKTMELRDYMIDVISKIEPINYFPPKFQIFSIEKARDFNKLDDVGEYSVEFLLAVSELLSIQEKTNYPDGSLTERLYKAFGEKDRFSVVHMASWRK